MKFKRLPITKLVCALSTILVFSSSSATAGGILFVDDDAAPGGNGASWNTAYRFLQDALADASGGGISEIHVAQGTYKPDRDEANPDGTGNREATFNLLNGVSLMGGYAGIGAKDPDSRDIELFETILIGDLLGNDEPEFINNEENSYHVVSASFVDQTAVIDGFTITAGNANGLTINRSGGGMYNSEANPTVDSCTFLSNAAIRNGGGMANQFFSNPHVINCNFIGNVADDVGSFGSGGGMDNHDGSSPNVMFCLFEGNYASSSGGGMRNSEESNPVIGNCSFIQNFAYDGGGMMNTLFSCPLIVDCMFTENAAYSNGGGILNADVFGVTIAKSYFINNASMQDGGAIHSNFSVATITECEFVGNTCLVNGGGIYSITSNTTISNCTFVGNSATKGLGGAIFNNDAPNNVVSNSILWDNIPNEIEDVNGSTSIVRYTNIQGDWLGSGNINVAPMFVDPNTGNYHLASGSPCIDAGHNWYVPVDANDYDQDGVLCELFPVDLDGNPRFNADEADFDPGCGVPVVVDMGAYEYQFDPVEQITFADLTGDNAVNTLDLLSLFAEWGECAKGCCLADLDIDGNVNTIDLLILFANWGPCL